MWERPTGANSLQKLRQLKRVFDPGWWLKQNPSHTDNLTALRRIEGQIRGVQNMIAQQKYCIDILNQIQAVKGALTRVEEKILAKHFEHCVKDTFDSQSEAEKQEKITELVKLIYQSRRK